MPKLAGTDGTTTFPTSASSRGRGGRTCHALPDNYAISVEEVPKERGGREGCGGSPPGIGASFLLERAIRTTDGVERPILLRLSCFVEEGGNLVNFTEGG